METTKNLAIRSTSIRLWIGILAAPIAWAATLQAKYAFVQWACQNRATWVMWLIAILGVVGCLAGALFAWSGWGGEERGRVRFMGIGGLIISLMFAMAIVAMAVPDIYLRPCD